MTEGVLAGRAALITGGADGIGRGIAARFAQAGGSVLLTDFDEEKGRDTTEALKAEGGSIDFLRCDVTDKQQVTDAVAACVERFGSIDILVNNAYSGSGLARIEDKTDAVFDYGMRICLYAAKWSMEAAMPHMRERGWGRIVNIASLNGVNAHMGSAEYNVGKEALRSYTRTAARECARHGICANIICPAAISAAYRAFAAAQPEMAAATASANPMGRMGDPEQDIGGVALFLASEDARYMTGNTLFVDGGSHINGAAWTPDLDAL
ncbi:SDR family NAD(P)-dependent oxidoreductase [Novosphingobium aquimarinum]|uniref:SDR family NAD(P)-dependent oxidoreductase n=1 Tax=Novosphingobium aquimarinum TaxID=2682494 RepID=UPI0012EBB8AD|nr:SDR family oxidoreductase [Novosphingobium aquimarinum]